MVRTLMISPQEAFEHKGTIVDVRTNIEHAEKHLVLAHRHIPLDELKVQINKHEVGLKKDATIYLLCLSGDRAEKAATLFTQAGYQNVNVIQGGLIACQHNGYEVEGFGSTANDMTSVMGPISLERQVRIAAGLLVATGALLGLFYNPAYTYLSLFVGCGLVFAGITNFCGMALLLAKAPWNNIKKVK